MHALIISIFYIELAIKLKIKVINSGRPINKPKIRLLDESNRKKNCNQSNLLPNARPNNMLTVTKKCMTFTNVLFFVSTIALIIYNSNLLFIFGYILLVLVVSNQQ